MGVLVINRETRIEMTDEQLRTALKTFRRELGPNGGVWFSHPGMPERTDIGPIVFWIPAGSLLSFEFRAPIDLSEQPVQVSRIR